MDELKALQLSIEKHAKELGIYMHAGDVINFLDHIGGVSDNCQECAAAMKAYTEGEVQRVEVDNA